MSDLFSLRSALEGRRREILRHPVYSELRDEQGLRLWMRSHVFAVWDFMSLLKALQRRLTSVDLPWRPVGDPESRRLVNEIVLAEESDASPEGGYASHLELYLRAMREAGADTSAFERFLEALERGSPVHRALEAPEVPEEARDFVRATFKILETESLPGIAAALAFGREELVPPMFLRWVESLKSSGSRSWSTLVYYLERHVQLDGEDHGPMAGRLLERVCGENPQAWREAERAAQSALTARLRLWDALHRRLLTSPGR